MFLLMIALRMLTGLRSNFVLNTSCILTKILYNLELLRKRKGIMKNKKVYSVLLLGTTLLLSACNQRSPRQRKYVEIDLTQPISKVNQSDPHVFEKKSKNMGNIDKGFSSPAKLSISWKIPTGWQETKGSSMRLASFSTSSDDPQNRIDCSIVLLRGQGGGLQSNVKRWLRQINVEASDKQLKVFLNNLEKTSTKSSLSVTIVDFTTLQSSDDKTVASMMVAIIQLKDATVFVKMTGDKGSIFNNTEKFRFLIHSIKL